MRRENIYRMPRAQALSFLRRAPYVHLAATDASGAPILRTVHGVVLDDYVCFHGAPAGEKLAALGRPCVLSAEEVVAEIPSYFLDPERACPATTYYESVQVHGVLEEVDDPHWKARALQGLMERFQPEGGHAPITYDDPRYRKQVDGILIVRVSLSTLDGKSKLGQNRQPAELASVLTQLWQRGRAEDPAAIERILGANPGATLPAFLTGPAGTRLVCAPRPDEATAAARLVAGTYWNGDFDEDTLTRCHLGTTAWVGARDGDGALVGTARAISDGAKRAWVYDVRVADGWQRRGIGAALLRLLLDHPALRRARLLSLATLDAQALYARFGFVEVGRTPAGRSEMLLTRAARAG